MVSHYYNKTDGLLCKLSSFCIRENYVKPTRGSLIVHIEVYSATGGEINKKIVFTN